MISNEGALDYYSPINEQYGSDCDDEMLLSPDSTSCVYVPDTIPITNTNLDELLLIINPMRDSDVCGTDIYLEVINHPLINYLKFLYDALFLLMY